MSNPKSYILPEAYHAELLRFLYLQPYGMVADAIKKLEALQVVTLQQEVPVNPASDLSIVPPQTGG